MVNEKFEKIAEKINKERIYCKRTGKRKDK